MKSQYELEYIIPVSPKLLFSHIATEEGLAKWFADKVYIKNKTITFVWSNSQHNAIILGYKDCKYLKFSWQEDIDENNGCFIEFSILSISNGSETLFKITDFSEVSEQEDNVVLWNCNIEQLKRSIGVANS